MSRPSLPLAPLGLLLAACGFVAGYVLANRPTVSSAPRSEGEPESTVAYVGSLQARIAALEKALEESRARSAEVVPLPGSPRSEAALDAPPDSDTIAAAITIEEEVADPARAAEVLAEIRAALEQGDAGQLAALLPSIAAQREYLAPELGAMLRDADSLFAMERLAELLGLASDPRGVEPLSRLLERETSDAVRNAAIRSLGQIGDPRAVPTLEAEFSREGDSPMPPSLAATSLGVIGTPGAIAALQTEIDEGENPMVRTFALRALAELADPQLAGYFFDQAVRENVSDRYRVEAIEALGATGNRLEVPRLERLAFSKEWSRAIEEAAKQAINRILGEVRYPLR